MPGFLLFSYLGAAAYIVAFPVIDFAPAGIVALVLWGLACQRERIGWTGWIALYGAGVFLFAGGCLWIADLNPIFPILMAVFEGLSLPLFALLYRINQRGPRWAIPGWLALPMAWVAVEYLRSVFPLDGFPWLLLGYTLWPYPALIQTADLYGVFGLSFLLALAAGVVTAWVVYLSSRKKTQAKRPLAGTALFVILAAVASVYGWIRPGTLEVKNGPVLAAVQGNLPQKLKDDTTRANEVYYRYLDTTRLLFEPGSGPVPDLVVWPETLFPYYLGEGRPGDRWYEGYGYDESLAMERLLIADRIVKNLLGPHDAWFLTGAPALRLGAEGPLEKLNGAFLYDTAGKRKGVYYKTLLVPGGEYLPFIDYLPFRDWLRTTIRQAAGFLPDLKPGFGPQIMQIRVGERVYRFGVQICFENIYGDYCRRFIRDGADFLINISNEGWFHSASEFYQMLAMSVIRAVEMRRTLFRSTNTGISCVIGPEGRVPGAHDRIMENGVDHSVSGILVKPVPICSSSSLYTRVGDLFAQAVIFVQIIFLVRLLFGNRWDKKVSLG